MVGAPTDGAGKDGQGIRQRPGGGQADADGGGGAPVDTKDNTVGGSRRRLRLKTPNLPVPEPFHRCPSLSPPPVFPPSFPGETNGSRKTITRIYHLILPSIRCDEFNDRGTELEGEQGVPIDPTLLRSQKQFSWEGNRIRSGRHRGRTKKERRNEEN